MNTEMTKAILDGCKTQFREVAKNLLENYPKVGLCKVKLDHGHIKTLRIHLKTYMDLHSKYKIDDILYVQESFIRGYEDYHEQTGLKTFYEADNDVHHWINGEDEEEIDVPWENASKMPEEYARIFLKVTSIRVEKFEDTIEDDIIKEGIPLDLKGDEDGLFMWEWLEQQYSDIEPDNYVLVYELERITNV